MPKRARTQVKKQATDANAPKKPPTVGQLYFLHRRPVLAKKTKYSKANGGYDFRLMRKDALDEFKKLSERKQARWQRNRARRMAIWKRAKAKYERELEENEGKPKKRRRTRDPTKPKRAMSAFLLFSNDKRPTLKGPAYQKQGKKGPVMDIGKVGKRLGEMWGELSEAERRPYDEQHAAAVATHAAAMEKWQVAVWAREAADAAKMPDTPSSSASDSSESESPAPRRRRKKPKRVVTRKKRTTRRKKTTSRRRKRPPTSSSSSSSSESDSSSSSGSD